MLNFATMMRAFKHPLKIFSATLLSLVFSNGASAGARFIFDSNKGTITIRADFRYFGDVRPEILEKATQNIAKQWQGEPTREGDTDVYPLYLSMLGSRSRVLTDIRAVYLPSIEAAYAEAIANQEPWVNYIRVEQVEPRENVSSMGLFNAKQELNAVGISSRIGFFAYNDELDSSTTPAHEFAHALGLNHPTMSIQGMKGYPPIMLPRGAIPNAPEFAYNPKDKKSTINPDFRRVRQEELDQIVVNLQNGESKVFYENPQHSRGYVDFGFLTPIDANTYQFQKIVK